MRLLRTWLTRLRNLGPGRLRLALLGAAIAATTLTVLTSLPAHAEPTPVPSAPTVPGQRTPSPEELEEIEQLLKEQYEKRDKAAQEAALEAEKERLRKLLPDEGGVLGVFNVTDANGLPISVYTVKSDTGGPLDWDLSMYNWVTEFCFMITKWLIAFCCWLIAWALSFSLAKLLLVPVLSVANSLHTRVILEMGLPSLFLAVCALICVARIFFGDKARGWGDAALSLLLAALTTTLLASPPQTLLGEETGALAVTRGLALEAADVILDANPATPEKNDGVTTPATGNTLARPLTDALTDAFIVKPAMLLQYGRVFEGECATAYADARLNQLVFDRGVHARADKLKQYTKYADYLTLRSDGSRSTFISSGLDWYVDYATDWALHEYGALPMDSFEKKCVPGDVATAKRASIDKVGGALFLLIAAIIVTLLIIRITGGFLVAQCGIAWDAVRGEPALIAGTIPGAGRAFLWDWAASVLHRLGQMLASVIVLAVLILIIQSVLDPAQAEWGRELTLRFLLVDIVCLGALKKRKALAARSKQVAANFRAKMAGARIGGTHGSVFTPPATAAVPKNRHLVRTTARGLVRTAMVGAAVAHGNPLAALGYAMPQTIGATALMSRLQSGSHRHRPRPARGRGRPAVARPGNGPGGPQPGTGTPQQAPQPNAPQGGQPRHPGQSPVRSRPAGSPRRPGTVRTPNPGSTPPATPGRSRRHVQAQRAVQRRIQRANTPPSRASSGPGGFEAWLADREQRELARRRRSPRSRS